MMSDGDSYELGQRLASDCMELIWAKHDELASDRGSKLTFREQLGIMEGVNDYLQTILHMAKDAKRKEDKVRT